MIFESVREVLKWYINRSDPQYSPLGAMHISDDSGVDISITNDGFDDVDTLFDIEKIIAKTISQLEKTVLFYHITVGLKDIEMPDGEIVQGSYNRFKNKIIPVHRKNGKIISPSLRSQARFLNFIKITERTLEQELIKAEYII